MKNRQAKSSRRPGLCQLGLCLLLVSATAWADENSDAEQARLDQACQAAREEKLAPERAALVQECVANKERPDEASCERFYADYGNQAGSRAPLYMDLPACVEAFDHEQGND